MYNIEDIFIQAQEDQHAISIPKTNGQSYMNNGVQIQKFPSKTEILNCSKSGDYYQECTEQEYEVFFMYGWKEGGIRLSMLNCKRKLDLIEDRIRTEVNTRKNDKHIQKLKVSRENLLIKYANRKIKLNQLTNGKEQEHL
jgi:hypothetical protein